MKFSILLAASAAALLTTTACNADKGGNSTATTAAGTTAKPVAPPSNGDWSSVVAKTAEGGFMMGNPNAKVKLVEFGSMTCAHCAEFEETGAPALIENYVKKGLVAFEFRNFVRDPADMTAALVARCNGPSSFFGLTRALFASQRDWLGKLQTADQATLQGLQNQPAAAQFKTFADLTGLPAFAAMRGVPKAKTAACLANESAASELVAMTAEATNTYQVPGTPTFLINGKVVPNAAAWQALEPAIKAALAS